MSGKIQYFFGFDHYLPMWEDVDFFALPSGLRSRWVGRLWFEIINTACVGSWKFILMSVRAVRYRHFSSAARFVLSLNRGGWLMLSVFEYRLIFNCVTIFFLLGIFWYDKSDVKKNLFHVMFYIML